MKNKSDLCSCLICHEVKSSKGIFSHYITKHTVEGNNKIQSYSHDALKVANKVLQDNKQARINNYLQNANKCKNCNNCLPYEKRTNKFCSSSCNATYNNSLRTLSEETKEKISASVLTTITSENIYPRYSKVSFCQICTNLIKYKHKKVCSLECAGIMISNKLVARIKSTGRSNYKGEQKSYMEESFERWLKDKKINHQYISEYTIHNTITKKWYFVDFYFPELKLIVELDGKQHETPEHKEADKLRDEYIRTHRGFRVFRISFEEYKKKTKVGELLEILVGPEGTAPS